MNSVATYFAVYRTNQAMPVALFHDEQDAKEWHDNPGVYSTARRRVIISPIRKPESEHLTLLRAIVDPNAPDGEMHKAIDRAKQLLQIK